MNMTRGRQVLAWTWEERGQQPRSPRSLSAPKPPIPRRPEATRKRSYGGRRSERSRACSASPRSRNLESRRKDVGVTGLVAREDKLRAAPRSDATSRPRRPPSPASRVPPSRPTIIDTGLVESFLSAHGMPRRPPFSRSMASWKLAEPDVVGKSGARSLRQSPAPGSASVLAWQMASLSPSCRSADSFSLASLRARRHRACLAAPSSGGPRAVAASSAW